MWSTTEFIISLIYQTRRAEKNKVLVFTDDSNIIGKYNPSELESDWSRKAKWVEENQFPLNKKRTEILVNCKGDTMVYVEKEFLIISKCSKYLVVWLDDKLNMRKHANSVKKVKNKSVLCTKKDLN